MYIHKKKRDHPIWTIPFIQDISFNGSMLNVAPQYFPTAAR
jgi:hypothetical protein